MTNRAKLLVSFIIGVFLILQAVVTFRIAPRGWPFITYPMYSKAHHEGDTIDEYFVFGTLKDSVKVSIDHQDLAISFWLFRRDFVAALRHDDNKKIQSYVEQYQKKHSKELVNLRLENHPLILSRQGLKPGKPQVLNVLQIESSKEQK